MAAAATFTNVLSVGRSTYVTDSRFLHEYLKETFGKEINFNIANFNDRWSFELDRKLPKEELERLATEVANRCEEALKAARSNLNRARPQEDMDLNTKMPQIAGEDLPGRNAQERERPGEGTPFATSSNFKITDISGGVPRTHVFNDATSLERLDRAVEDPASKGVRAISLAGTRGTSPLEITSPVAARLLRQHWVRPEYLRILLSFGNIPLEPEARNSYVSFHQDVNGNVSLAYRLVYSERNRTEAWTLRQIGIYHHRPQSSQYSPIGDRAMGTMGLRVDDETIRNVKTLRHLYDLSLFGGAACASNVDIARALVARFPAIPQGEVDSLRASADMLGGLAESCGVLQKKIKNATDLVGHLIAFHYQVETAKLESEVRDVTARMATLTEENRDLTKQLRELAEGTSEMTGGCET
ncbi:hypothetical protein RB597_000545 [Gaeumannomyces tritici]